ncbi:unnamed protein product [marine sediment metagenome]|uniref:Uncharacterized protein n=1 Tax=marine sediment metagenome TaxID=412755 RepID=X0UJE2_9ZZZZ
MTTWQRILAALGAVATIVTACGEFTRNYSIELHLVPIWGENEELPERLTR